MCGRFLDMLQDTQGEGPQGKESIASPSHTQADTVLAIPSSPPYPLSRYVYCTLTRRGVARSAGRGKGWARSSTSTSTSRSDGRPSPSPPPLFKLSLLFLPCLNKGARDDTLLLP